jgi:flagellar protein FlaJ
MFKTVPFVPFPIRVALKASRSFTIVGSWIEKFSPGFDLSLKQAEIELRAKEYFAIALFSFFFWFTIIFSLFAFLGKIFELQRLLLFDLLISSSISILAFVYILMYPKLIITRRLLELDKNLLYGLRYLTIQIKSGVPLFDALVSISKQNYGRLSEEFGNCVKRVSTGMPVTQALEELVLKNPSLYFRRSLWQLINSMRTGTDLGSSLDSMISSLSSEQSVAMRRYGSQLSPLAMMYMMLAVIIPSLGITFIILLSSFSGLPITKSVFWMILAFLVVFQFAFIGLIKSRRPPIEI